MAGRVNALVSLKPLGTAVQLPPPSVEYCHAPVAAVDGLAVMATPARLSAAEPPLAVWLSKLSLKLPPNRVLIAVPGGSAASSAVAVKLAAPVATGALLTLATEILMTSVSASASGELVP